MKSNSKKKIFALIIVVLLVVIGALFYKITINPVELKYNKTNYHEWTYKPNAKLSKKYYEFTNGNYGKSEIFSDEESYNDFIEKYELEDVQMYHDFGNHNYIIVMFYIGSGEVLFDDCFNSKEKELKFTINKFEYDYYIADAEHYEIFEIELPKNIDNVVIKYNADNNIEYDKPDIYKEKPIIYIYPERDIDLTVKLGNDSLLTHTYPKYDNEWNVHVDTNGNIYDYKTNRNYYALYWEGIDNSKLDMSEGFVVKGEDTTKFLEEKLELLGLNEKEIDEFIMYWLPRIEDNKYNFIRFRTAEEIDNYMPIEFSEEPDTLIRVMVDFKPLDKKIKVKEQKLEKVEREGFTIVEWGARLM